MRLNALVLQSLTKGAKLEEFTLVEAAAGFVYVIVAIVEDALLPAAWVRKHLSRSVHDDALFAQALALLPPGQHRLLVAVSAVDVWGTPHFSLNTLQVKKHLRHLAQFVSAEQLETLVRLRCGMLHLDTLCKPAAPV
jgi:hypothetical protein